VFWKMKSASEDEPAVGGRTGAAAATSAAGTSEHADAALDTVVGMLRVLGRYAFDLTGVDASTFRRHCEAWAEHLAIGGPRPESQDAGEPRPFAERDWAGARHFVLKRRQDECDDIARSIGDLREVIADLTERLATRFLEGIRRLSVTRDEQRYPMTASIGLAELKRGENSDSWLERADRALYQARSNGRQQLVIAP
jgi:hypothetical protein